MQCKRFGEFLPEYADGRMKGPIADALRLHLDTCESCREGVRLYQETWKLLGVYPPIEPSADFLSRVRRRLRHVPWFWKVAAPLVGAAAALVVALVVFTNTPHPYVSPKDGPGVEEPAPTEEEKELVENLELLENYELLQALELVGDEKSQSPEADLLRESGDHK